MAHELLAGEKLRIFSINLSTEELEQVGKCRRGIFWTSTLGAVFGVAGGKVVIGSTPAPIFTKSIVYGACMAAGAIIGASLAIQQSYHYLKSQQTNLAQELKSFTTLKRSLYKRRDPKDADYDHRLDEIFHKRSKKLVNVTDYNNISK